MVDIVEKDLDSLAPYEGGAFREGLQRLLKSPILPEIVKANFPKVSFEEFAKLVGSLRNADEYHQAIIVVAIKSLLKRTSAGMTLTGLERTQGGRRYVYISNHRDIICDPALFATGILIQGRKTPKILLGDNLLVTPFITDMVKTNKGVTVKRNLSQRELFKWSQVLSAYVRREIASGTDSIWIAQREGRAKDGNDRTHPGVLKMLALSGDGDLVDNLAELHIVPVAVSYEYDPCDALKAREVYLTEVQGSYTKAPGEDALSMGLGIKGWKGRIHQEVGSEITEAIERARATESRKDRVAILVDAIDRQILTGYKLWPTNWIAYDLVEQKDQGRAHYDPAKKEEFVVRMEKQLDALKAPDDHREGIKRRLLEQYANPVRNALAYGVSG